MTVKVSAATADTRAATRAKKRIFIEEKGIMDVEIKMTVTGTASLKEPKEQTSFSQ